VVVAREAEMRKSRRLLVLLAVCALLGGGCSFDIGDICDAAQSDLPTFKDPSNGAQKEDLPWCPKCDSNDVQRTKAGKVGNALGVDSAKDLFKCRKCGHRFQ
jgi:hypothetical protein